MQRATLFVTMNGICILFGLVAVVFLPDHDIPKWTVVMLCVWNFMLGRLLDRSLREDGI